MPKTRLALRFVPLALLAACSQAPATDAATTDTPTTTSTDVSDDRVASTVVGGLKAGEPQSVIVIIEEDQTGDDASLSQAAVLGPALPAARAKSRLVSALAETDVAVADTYDHLPLMHLEVGSLDALNALLARPEVVSVHENPRFERSLTESLPLIGQPTAASNGATGAGTAVAILDTGLDYTRAAFGTCPSVGAPGCRVVYAADIAADDGKLDDNGHGTNVGGIVAGVAPDAKIIALDVFAGQYAYGNDILAAINWVVAHRADYNIVAMNMSLGGGLYASSCDSDPFAVAIHAARQAGVLAAVASGNDASKTKVASPACAPDAVSVGAVYDSNIGGVRWSVCTDAVTSADRVTCFSNAAPFLTLLAPGALITAAGYTMGGTSQATPHVAGAIAVLRAAFPNESLDETVGRLRTTGKPVTDPSGGLVVPRIDLAAATASGCFFQFSPATPSFSADAATGTVTLTTSPSCSWTAAPGADWLTVSPTSGTGSATLQLTVAANVGAARATTVAIATASLSVKQTADVSPPIGTLTINAGATYTRSATVTLGITATDPTGVAAMCVSNSTKCTAWEPLVARKTWTLTSGTAGSRTVYLRLKDALGNASAVPLTASIVLDGVAPTQGTVTATPRDGAIDLTWSGFADTSSGIASYTVVGAAGTAPASCTATSPLYSGTDTKFSHTGLTNGSTYGYRVCATDVAGNLSGGVVVTARPAPELDAPTGTLTIAGGAATRSAAVTLVITGQDASGLGGMCISNAKTCTTWEAFATSKAWTLASGATGTRTVSLWLRDVWGNTTAQPITASIMLDVTAPTNGTVTAVPADGQVTLSWKGFSDSTTGVAGYTVVGLPSNAPASCAGVTALYMGADTSFVVKSLANGTTYGFRVCATDAVGNVSTGVVVTARPAPEMDAPTGTLVINGGAKVTGVYTVTLAITGSDASGVKTMCLSNTTKCGTSEAFATTRTWSLTSGASGQRTVSLWLGDAWGNVSATPITATIYVDVTAPAGGTLTATPAKGQVALAWSGITDATSGVTGYTLVGAASKTAPGSCSGTALYKGTGTSFTHTGLTTGTWSYRLCAVDGVGNVSAGLTKTVTVP